MYVNIEAAPLSNVKALIGMSVYLMTPKHLSVGGVKRSKVLVEYHPTSCEVMLNMEAMVRMLSPGFTPDEMLARYKQVMKLNPQLAGPHVPDFSVLYDKETCVNCGMECSKSKSRCGSCMQSSLRVYYCSKDCQRAHWPVHKPCCTQTHGVFSFDGASWSNLMKGPMRSRRQAK